MIITVSPLTHLTNARLTLKNRMQHSLSDKYCSRRQEIIKGFEEIVMVSAYCRIFCFWFLTDYVPVIWNIKILTTLIFGASIWLRVGLCVRACCTLDVPPSVPRLSQSTPPAPFATTATYSSVCLHVIAQPVCRSDRVMFLIGQPSASLNSHLSAHRLLLRWQNEEFDQAKKL